MAKYSKNRWHQSTCFRYLMFRLIHRFQNRLVLTWHGTSGSNRAVAKLFEYLRKLLTLRWLEITNGVLLMPTISYCFDCSIDKPHWRLILGLFLVSNFSYFERLLCATCSGSPWSTFQRRLIFDSPSLITDSDSRNRWIEVSDSLLNCWPTFTAFRVMNALLYQDVLFNAAQKPPS